MNKHNVKTAADALLYITDCTLATVCDMAQKKSRQKHEYARQKAIAQQAIDWMKRMGISPNGTRAYDVSLVGSVEKWASWYEPKQDKP